MRIALPARSLLKPIVHMGILITCFVLLQGCAEYRLKMMDSDPEQTPYESRTVHAYLWGKLYDPQQITAGCNTETGINDVVVKNNYLYSLASVFTFGIWMPIEIDYRCQSGPGEVIEIN